MYDDMIAALLAKGNQSWIAYSLITLVVIYALTLWLAPSRSKALETLASQMGLRFDPILSCKEIGIRGTTFDLGYPAENCMRGLIAGRDTLIFDKTMLLEPVRSSDDNTVYEQTVVGFRVSPDIACRNRSITQLTDWHVEKMGEWVFVYGRTGLVKPRNIAAYIEESRGWFERSTDPNAEEFSSTTRPLG